MIYNNFEANDLCVQVVQDLQGQEVHLHADGGQPGG